MILKDIDNLLKEEGDLLAKAGGITAAGLKLIRNPTSLLDPSGVYRTFKTGQAGTQLAKIGIQSLHNKMQQNKLAKQMAQTNDNMNNVY